ncbi:hypothetical protein AVEN_224169-1, partial [Araneus ventricosus]
GGTTSTRMSCCRTSKQELASPGGIEILVVLLPPSSDSTYLLRVGSSRGPMMGCKDSGLSTRAIATAVFQDSGCFSRAGVTWFAVIY